MSEELICETILETGTATSMLLYQSQRLATFALATSLLISFSFLLIIVVAQQYFTASTETS
jgi:hypothetical protein